MAHGCCCCCQTRTKSGRAGLCLCLINLLSLKGNAASCSLSFCMDQHGRRLFELLEEQQELLEHGHSDRAVNSAACICWLGSACRRLKRLSDYWFERKKKVKAVRLLIKRAVADDAELDRKERSPVSVLALHSHQVEEESTSLSSSESTGETENSKMLEFEESLPGCDENITISELKDGDLSEWKREWSQFEHERREVGTEIEHIIFEEIRRETALDLLLHCSNCMHAANSCRF